MRSKAPWYRLGVSLLVLVLIFAGAQMLEWAPDVSAGVNFSQATGLTLNPHSSIPPSVNVTYIDHWYYNITAPGYYALSKNISGTKGWGVKIESVNVTLWGNGYYIKGDGVSGEFGGNEEKGVKVSSGTDNVTIYGINFEGLDYGSIVYALENDSLKDIRFVKDYFKNSDYGVSIFAFNNSILDSFWFEDNTFVNNSYGFEGKSFGGDASNWVFYNNTFINNDEGFSWYITQNGTASDWVFYNNTFEDNEKGFYYWNDDGSTQNISIYDNEFYDNEYDDFLFLNYGNVLGFKISNNYFSGGGYGIEWYNYEGADMEDVNITNNIFYGTGPGIFIKNEGNFNSTWVGENYFEGCQKSYWMPDSYPLAHIAFFGGGNNIWVYDNVIYNGTDLGGIDFIGEEAGKSPRPFYNVSVYGNWIEGLQGNDNTGTAPGMHFYNYYGDYNCSADYTGLCIYNNAFVNNSGPGISHTLGISSPENIYAFQNWWGDPAGPQGPQGDGISSNVVVTQTKEVEPKPIVGIIKAGPGQVQAGGLLTYTIIITNTGDAPVGMVLVVDRPMSATVAWYSDNPVVANNVVTWTQPVLAPSGRVTYTLVVTVNQGLTEGTIITNTAWLTSEQGISASASVGVVISRPGFEIYLPLVLKNY